MNERRPWSAWHVVLGFGAISLAVDLVADGARSIAGPLLGSLGASALVVGVVTGAAEGLGFVLRLATGPAVDRTRRYWGFTIVGYVMTAVSVPLLAITPFLGAMGLSVAATLIILERTGKAVRSPAKTALLAHAASAVGRGRGFAVHKVMDQIGAFSGPLIVAGVIALTGALWPAFAVLTLPAIIAVLVLAWLRLRVPDPSIYEVGANSASTRTDAPAAVLPERFWTPARTNFVLFSASTGLTAFGLVGFGVISFHATDAGLVSLAVVPLVFAGGMLAAAGGAIGSGQLYDRIGASVLLAVPVMAAFVPALTLANGVVPLVLGVVLWGAATGIQDSTVKALVADLVTVRRRGTSYGIFAVFQGAGTFLGAVVAGGFYPDAAALSRVTVPAQVVAFVLLLVVILRQRRSSSAPVRP